MEKKPKKYAKGVTIPETAGKTIVEMVGRVASEESDVSIARMVAPPGWTEPAQVPEFAEYTLMVRGKKRVHLPDGEVDLSAGEVLYVPEGTRVQYSNPFGEDAEYWSLCIPAFSPDLAHREE